MTNKRRGISYNDYYYSDKIPKFANEKIKKISVSNSKIEINMSIDDEELDLNLNVPNGELKEKLIPINLENIGNLPDITIYMQIFASQIYVILPQHTIIFTFNKTKSPTYEIYNESL